MLRWYRIIKSFWGFNCASNFAFSRPFLFWKGICKVPRCNGLEILVPKHLWKLILATKRYVTFFWGRPVLKWDNLCNLYLYQEVKSDLMYSNSNWSTASSSSWLFTCGPPLLSLRKLDDNWGVWYAIVWLGKPLATRMGITYMVSHIS